jgi:hypothetical protein
LGSRYRRSPPSAGHQERVLTATTDAALEPWSVSSSHFPEEREAADKLTFLLRYAVLAPSGHNTQPWLFSVRGDTVDLYADRTQALPVVDPGTS